MRDSFSLFSSFLTPKIPTNFYEAMGVFYSLSYFCF